MRISLIKSKHTSPWRNSEHIDAFVQIQSVLVSVNKVPQSAKKQVPQQQSKWREMRGTKG